MQCGKFWLQIYIFLIVSYGFAQIFVAKNVYFILTILNDSTKQPEF